MAPVERNFAVKKPAGTGASGGDGRSMEKIARRSGIVEDVILGQAESAGSGVALIEYRKPTLLRWNSFFKRQTEGIYYRNIADGNSESNVIERTFTLIIYSFISYTREKFSLEHE